MAATSNLIAALKGIMQLRFRWIDPWYEEIGTRIASNLIPYTTGTNPPGGARLGEMSFVVNPTPVPGEANYIPKFFDGTSWYNMDAGGAGGYVLPIASAGTLGGIRVGSRLSIDSSGILSADAQSSPPGGLNTYVQFNDGGVFGGDSKLAFNKTSGALTFSGVGSITQTTGTTGLLFNTIANAANYSYQAFSFRSGYLLSAVHTRWYADDYLSNPVEIMTLDNAGRLTTANQLNTVTVNATGVNIANNGFVALNGSNTYVGSNNGFSFNLKSGITDGATAVGTIIDTFNTLATTGAKIINFRNNGAEKAYIDKDGAAYFLTRVQTPGDVAVAGTVYNYNSNTLLLQGTPADSASAVGVSVNASPALTAAGSKLLSIRNGGTEYAYFETYGNLYSAGGWFKTVGDFNKGIVLHSTNTYGTYSATLSVVNASTTNMIVAPDGTVIAAADLYVQGTPNQNAGVGNGGSGTVWAGKLYNINGVSALGGNGATTIGCQNIQTASFAKIVSVINGIGNEILYSDKDGYLKWPNSAVLSANNGTMNLTSNWPYLGQYFTFANQGTTLVSVEGGGMYVSNDLTVEGPYPAGTAAGYGTVRAAKLYYSAGVAGLYGGNFGASAGSQNAITGPGAGPIFAVNNGPTQELAVDYLGNLTVKGTVQARSTFEDDDDGTLNGVWRAVGGDPAFPTSIIWYQPNHSTKVKEISITRNANMTPSVIVYMFYDGGGTLVRTITDTITYSGVFETERTRVVT